LPAQQRKFLQWNGMLIDERNIRANREYGLPSIRRDTLENVAPYVLILSKASKSEFHAVTPAACVSNAGYR
jgi:hypothetical protein